jgi:acetolactate synthase-1/2/3 large subunit
MGVSACRVDTAEAFTAALARALAQPGPQLIEAVVPSAFSGLKLRVLPWLLRALGQMPLPVARALKRKLAP